MFSSLVSFPPFWYFSKLEWLPLAGHQLPVPFSLSYFLTCRLIFNTCRYLFAPLGPFFFPPRILLVFVTISEQVSYQCPGLCCWIQCVSCALGISPHCPGLLGYILLMSSPKTQRSPTRKVLITGLTLYFLPRLSTCSLAMHALVHISSTSIKVDGY